MGLSPKNKLFIIYLEICTWAAIGFQNASSPLIEELIFFHDHTITILILITTIVGFNLLSSYTNLNMDKFIIESQPLELFWTIIPTFVLIFIGIPSIRLLYLIDEVNNPILTIKTIGHQWYWSYEYSDFLTVEFDSYINQFNLERPISEIRLLDVDNRIILPFNSQTRILITAIDVLHSWTIPSLGVKVDAIPGRLNQINFNIKRPGIFFGQCSEICGANHRFIPISIESVNSKTFTNWLKTFNK